MHAHAIHSSIIICSVYRGFPSAIYPAFPCHRSSRSLGPFCQWVAIESLHKPLIWSQFYFLTVLSVDVYWATIFFVCCCIHGHWHRLMHTHTHDAWYMHRSYFVRVRSSLSFRGNGCNTASRWETNQTPNTKHTHTHGIGRKKRTHCNWKAKEQANHTQLSI